MIRLALVAAAALAVLAVASRMRRPRPPYWVTECQRCLSCGHRTVRVYAATDQDLWPCTRCGELAMAEDPFAEIPA